ncbi:AraC family transcriptional regulator [Chamaesiphon polymorphus]|nr:AraC family transcriptional regulator [Chamaesiphon polymorphus]
MQQHNGKGRALLCNSPDAAPSQRMIQREQSPAYYHSQQHGWAERTNNGKQNLGENSWQETIGNAIGDYRLHSLSRSNSSDSATNLRCDARPPIASNFQLIDLRWQGAFKLEQAALDERYIFYIVSSGSLEQKIDRYQTDCSAATATIGCPTQTVESIASESGQVLLISIDRDAIESAVSKLLDRPLKHPVVFMPNIDLTNEVGLSLKKFSQFLWEVATTTAATSVHCSSLVLQKLEATFLACAIEGLQSNYSDELSYQIEGALAYHVRKAQTFIESHLHEDIKLADIADATGVSARLLQKAFALHCDCSPMRFMAQARLHRIRRELAAATTDTKVVDVMMKYGFTQGGKFAKEYQQLFGEKPSDTLKHSSPFDRQNVMWQEIDDPLSARVAGGRSRSIQMGRSSECLLVNSLGRRLSARAVPDFFQTLLAKIVKF